MTRHVRSKIGWDEASGNEIVNKTRLLGILRNVLGNNHPTNGSASSIRLGRIEGFKTHFGLASVKEAEALLRRARTLQ